MRPEILFSLYSPVTEINGVGPRIAKLIEKLGAETQGFAQYYAGGILAPNGKI